MKRVYDVGLEVEFTDGEEARLAAIKRDRQERRPQRDLTVRKAPAPEADVIAEVLGWRP